MEYYAPSIGELGFSFISDIFTLEELKVMAYWQRAPNIEVVGY